MGRSFGALVYVPYLAAVLVTAGCGARAHSDPPPDPGDDDGTATSPPPLDSSVLLSQNQRELAMEPRRQWLANFGYCGEVSLISAGLLNGQYLSQYDARALASPGVPQASAGSQLLLGVNDVAAAAAMRLKAEAYVHPKVDDARDFLSWIKGNLIRGYPVVIGLYMNQSRFHDFAAEGDSEYDHIVPVFGIGSPADWGDGTYHGDDSILLSDNGLWQTDNPPTKFVFTFDNMPKTRRQANRPNADLYSLPSGVANYGIAVTGIVDDDGECLPVHVTTDPNSEPAIAEGVSARPEAAAMTLTITVEGLTPGVDYRLYRYDDITKVPRGKFNAQASAAKEVSTIRIASGKTYSTFQTIPSSETAVYRVVPATAP